MASLRHALLMLCLLPLANAAHAREPAAGPTATAASMASDLAYGNDPRQRLDLYLPTGQQARAVIFMVHGGGWSRGDKRAPGVVDNKQAYWLPRGYGLVSINYRLLPDARPDQQVQDVARALAFAQAEVQRRGGDPAQFVLMGHSAGAHLVALLAASPELAARAGVQPWKATISLDSAAMDVPSTMSRPHLPLYDQAFGNQASYWARVSPLQNLQQRMPPLLAVCSSSRRLACPHNRALVARARQLGGVAQLLEVPMTHAEINHDLGEPSDYTRRVADFIETALGQR